MKFRGVLTLIGKVSDGTVGGARGHRIILPEAAAKEALAGLVGLSINFTTSADGHDILNKCGEISGAEIVDAELRICGLMSRDCPSVIAALLARPDDFGMSYEMEAVHIACIRSEVWTITKTSFTGAAILLKSAAAYRETSFKLDGPAGVRA